MMQGLFAKIVPQTETWHGGSGIFYQAMLTGYGKEQSGAETFNTVEL
jgi:hypothetical protein